MSGIGNQYCDKCKMQTMDSRPVRLRVPGKAMQYETKTTKLCEGCRELYRGKWKYA